MTAFVRSGPTPAQEVADALRGRLEGPWSIFGERLVHHEVHLQGSRIELLRGPIELSGYAIRLYRARSGVMGVGNSSSNEFSPAAIKASAESAELLARHGTFPAAAVELPSDSNPGPALEMVDPRVRDDAQASMLRFVEELLQDETGTPGVNSSFGSVRVTYSETSVVNSAGVDRVAPSTLVQFEWALKSSGGPEGAPAGEYWVTRTARRLSAKDLGLDLPRWRTVAGDVRRAKPPSIGPQTVVFPPEVLHDILPDVIGFRLSGTAERRGIASPLDSTVGSELVTIRDDPHVPWATGSAPFDDEGVSTRAHVLIEKGRVRSHVYDVLNGAALHHPSTGNGWRSPQFGESWYRFNLVVGASPSNLLVEHGHGGSDAALIESIDEGLWLDQLGYAFPDGMGGTFGGEIRIGYRIHRGKLSEPVRGGIVGGLVPTTEGSPSLLGGVTAVGSEARLVGGFRSPPLVVSGFPVAGA
jgi:predicted Zn-dependent protease